MWFDKSLLIIWLFNDIKVCFFVEVGSDEYYNKGFFFFWIDFLKRVIIVLYDCV